MSTQKMFWKRKISKQKYEELGSADVSVFSNSDLFAECQEQMYRKYIETYGARQLILVTFLCPECGSDQVCENEEGCSECQYSIIGQRTEYIWEAAEFSTERPWGIISHNEETEELKLPKVSHAQALESIISQLQLDYDIDSTDDIIDYEVLETAVLYQYINVNKEERSVKIPISLLSNVDGYPLDLEDVI